MIRVLLFFGLLFLAAFGFAWLADLPGVISISWNGYVWEKSPVVVMVVFGVILAIFLAAVWLIRVILKSPQIASRFFRRRRKDKGYEALSNGLIALGTGNAKLARRYALDADKLLADEPATRLLLAQTAQLAGKDEEARQRFEEMLDDPRTKALGLHGLFVEAERHGEPVAARHYAEEAAKTAPGLEWAGKAVLGYQAVAHHWDEAIKTLERNYAAKLVDKKTYRRERAVILTALAQSLESGEPERAYSLAKEAHGLALDLVPAAVLTSRLATRRGDIRKASKVLEATWRLFPHPELAETYAHVRTGDSAVDRLKRVKSLSAQRANTAEGALAIARAALEAREFGEARAQLKKVLQTEPTRKAYVLMAEVEEAEHGDRGRTRDWLTRAVSAPQDKAWIADGIVSAEWQPVSPVTGRLDAFEWKSPSGLPEEDGAVLEDSAFDMPSLPVAPSAAPASSAAPHADIEDVPADEPETVELTPEKPPVKAQDNPSAGAGAKSEEAPDSPVRNTVAVEKTGYEGTTDDVKYTPPLNDLPEAAPGSPVQAPEVTAPSDKKADAVAGVPETGVSKETERPAAQAEEAKPSGSPAAAPPAAETKSPVPSANGPDTVREAADAKSGAEAAKTAAKTAGKDDMKRPIEFPLSRMPDDPGTDDDDEDLPVKTPRPRFFN